MRGPTYLCHYACLVDTNTRVRAQTSSLDGFFKITDNFQLGGIALGTIVIIAGYHLAKAIAPPGVEGTMMAVGSTGAHEADHAAPHLHKPEE